MPNYLIPAFLSLLLSFGGVFVIRMINRRLKILDIPNERSSHDRAVPRGGGIAIVVVSIGLLIAFVPGMTASKGLIFIFSAIVLALTGFLDDVFSLPLLPRLAVQVIVATVVALFCGYYHSLKLPFFSETLEFGQFGLPITILFVLVTVNAYNFMDGIDGLAGIQGISVSITWIVHGVITGNVAIQAAGAIILGSCLGFLFLNWQPASIFMGDSGSMYLGFCLSFLPVLLTENIAFADGAVFFLVIVSLWLFFFDAIFTRVRMILDRQRFWVAHRHHLYQKLVHSGVKHRDVSIFFGLSGLLIGIACALEAAHNGFSTYVLVLLMAGFPAILFSWTQKRLTSMVDSGTVSGHLD